MNYLTKFKNLMLYGGLSREDFHSIREDLERTNRGSVLTFSVILAVTFVTMTLMAILNVANTHETGITYPVCALIFLVILLLNRLTDNRTVTYVSLALFLVALPAFGIYMATVLGADQRTTLFLVFQIVLPLLFCLRPILMTIILIAAQLVYHVVIVQMQSGQMLSVNLLNTYVILCIAIVLGIYMTTIKIARLNSDRLNKYLLETDTLTGVLNRHSYEAALNRLRTEHIPYTIAAFDVNGLKSTNDNLGHAAGDALIQRAAQCIQEVFSPYGSCFRTGGDEFVAVLRREPEDMDALVEAFHQRLKGRPPEENEAVSVSMGLISSKEMPEATVDDIVSQADQRMYADKAAYYRASGRDRRRSRD